MVTVPANYKPTEKEPYMNPVMLEYFRVKLIAWKESILQDATSTLQDLQDEAVFVNPTSRTGLPLKQMSL